MEASSLHALPAVLALELSAGSVPARTSLSRDEAAELATLVAADLQALLPQVDQARLALVGAWFDTVELLRPGFPVWASLDELARRTPRGHLEHVVAFGAHDGQMPTPALQPEPAYADGPMRLLPWSLLTTDALAETLGAQLEIELVGRGEAGARTADWLMRTLGVQLEHVRYLSRNDLLALTCVQYEHVNLAPLWTLLEAALLTPYRDEDVLSARGLSLRYHAGGVQAQSPAQWLAREEGEAAQRRHAFAGIVFELRQYGALLEAHGLPLSLQSSGEQPALTPHPGYLLEILAAPEAGYEAPTLVAHEAPGLGVVAVTAAQRVANGHVRALAHGYPMQPQALGALVAALADHYAIPVELHALGQIVFDSAGELGAPTTALH